MIFVIYLLGILIAYCIILGFVEWTSSYDTEITNKNKWKCLIISLFSWIIVIIYLVLICIVAYKTHKLNGKGNL